MTQQVDNEFGDGLDTDPRVSRILDIFAKETATDRASLRPDATIQELGVASLDLTMAVFQLESDFDIEIPVVAGKAGNEFGTVGELVRYVIEVMDKAALDKVGAPAHSGAHG